MHYSYSLVGHFFFFFFFNDTATTEIYTLSLHDALPIYLNAHHTILSARRRPLLEHLRPGIKDGEVVVVHFSEPQPSLVVDGEAHQSIVWLREGVLAKGTDCQDGRGSVGLRLRWRKRRSTRLRSLHLCWTLGNAA